MNARLESERDDVRQAVRGEFMATIENMVKVRMAALRRNSDSNNGKNGNTVVSLS